MAQLNQHFDASAVEPAAPFELLPPGRYSVQIVQSEMRATRAGNGQYLWLEMDVIEGPHQGRKIWDQLNLVNPNQQTVEIAQRTLSAICHAVGKLSVQDSEELHSIPMVAVVKVDPPRSANGKDYGPSNSIKTYKAITSSAPAAKPATSGFKPAAAPSGGGTTPPWKRNAA